MHYSTVIHALLASSASAQVSKGFNYGATTATGACVDQAGFTRLFNKANSLQGASGFTSARLYTTVQCGTPNSPTSAIQAAIDTQTTLLLGMWASAGSDAFTNEITALTSAIKQYPNLADHVLGISVGSEDLYRSSPQGVANQAGVGANAGAITDYISRVRTAIAGTSLASKPIGHVDTWTAWVLPENAQVAQAVDFLGHNSFPYFESTRANSIAQGADNFNSALANTESVSGGKPVWVTETGWPHTGKDSGQAVASTENAETYWQAVGCSLFGNRNTWWYTLEDANTAQTDIEFGVTTPDSNTPLYDLTCGSKQVTSSSSAPASTSSTSAPPATSQTSSSSTTSESSVVSQSAASTTMSSASSSTTQASSMSTLISNTSVSSATSTDETETSTPPSDTTATMVVVVNPTGSPAGSSSTTSSTTTAPGNVQTGPTNAASSGHNKSVAGALMAILGLLALY